MGSRGPAPEPPNLTVLKGNPGHLSKAELERRGKQPSPQGVPSPPTWLGREAKAEWRRIVPRLDAAGMLSTVDRGLISTWCETWATFVQASKELTALGTVTRSTERGESIATAWRVKREAASLLRSLAAEMGLSYASRARNGAAYVPEPDDGPADGGLEGVLGA